MGFLEVCAGVRSVSCVIICEGVVFLTFARTCKPVRFLASFHSLLEGFQTSPHVASPESLWIGPGTLHRPHARQRVLGCVSRMEFTWSAAGLDTRRTFPSHRHLPPYKEGLGNVSIRMTQLFLPRTTTTAPHRPSPVGTSHMPVTRAHGQSAKQI